MYQVFFPSAILLIHLYSFNNFHSAFLPLLLKIGSSSLSTLKAKEAPKPMTRIQIDRISIVQVRERHPNPPLKRGSSQVQLALQTLQLPPGTIMSLFHANLLWLIIFYASDLQQ